jgi:hypothetical protein
MFPSCESIQETDHAWLTPCALQRGGQQLEPRVRWTAKCVYRHSLRVFAGITTFGSGPFDAGSTAIGVTDPAEAARA